MQQLTFFKKSLSFATVSIIALSALSGCSLYNSTMPSGYKHNSSAPLSDAKISKPYSKKLAKKVAAGEQDYLQGRYAYKDEVDALIEQIALSLNVIDSEDEVFLVSEQKDRDFDDALRLALRNHGVEIGLTSLARYQLVYSIRGAKKDDFIGMSIQPEADKVKAMEYYGLTLIDTAGGDATATAYLIPGYRGFKTYESPLATDNNADSPAPTAVGEIMAEPALANASHVKATPVMDYSPMQTPPGTDPELSRIDANGAMPSTQNLQNQSADSAPMPITTAQ